MTTITRQYFRIDSSDPQLSALNAIAQVLNASGLDTGAQCHALRYLLDSKQRAVAAALNAPTVVGVAP